MTRRDALVTRDDFEMWIVHMDDALEAWLLEQCPCPEALMARSESKVLDGAARYIGEAFRMTVGGRWTIDLENRKRRISVCRC
jgi:hypothetical protein